MVMMARATIRVTTIAWTDPEVSVLRQLLGEHHEDSAGSAEVREFVNIGVGRHAAQRIASVPRSYLEGLVDVVD